jgi:predicted acetyltransferase
MPLEVRPVADAEELKQAWFAIGQYLGPPPTDADAERFLRVIDLERMYAARENGVIVGGAGAFAFDLSIPGGSVPTAGVTGVGVYPTHRRRGVLRGMMQAQLDDARERGEPIAALWATEETIYGRFGFGLAAWAGEVRIPREYSAFAQPFEQSGSLRFVEAEEALDLFPPVWLGLRAQRPGMYVRPRDWWRDRTFRDPEEQRHGAGPKRFVVHETGGEPSGYAIYRHKPSFEAGSSTGALQVLEAMGATPAATRDVWRYLLDIDWAATIEARFLPPDHPLFLLLATPRRARYRIGDSLWIRIVDVGAGLSARSYRGEDAVVFEVRDAFCDWNDGRWKLEAGRAGRTDEEPDLLMDVDALGSAYLGGVTFAQLQRAFRLEELVEGAVPRADDLFRTDAHPWCPEIF